MPFMLIIFAALFGIVLWAFFHYRPRGVRSGPLLAYNIATLALGVPLSWLAAHYIYAGGADMPEKQKVIAYLAFMSGGSAYLLTVTISGLLRNLFVYPLSRRGGAPEDHHVV